MAGLNHSRLMAGKVVENPQKEQDEEDLAILSSDSESEIFDANDLDYVPQVQSADDLDYVPQVQSADDLDYVPQVQSADDLDQGSSNLDHSCRV